MQQLSDGLWIKNSEETRPVAVHVNAKMVLRVCALQIAGSIQGRFI